MRRQRGAPQPQRLDAPLTSCATFLTLTVNTSFGADSSKTDPMPAIRSTLARVSDLSKNVSMRDLSANLTCTVGIGASIWDRFTSSLPRPAELRPFRSISGGKHAAPSTPGDLFFHIRAERRDLCFELERQILDSFGGAVRVEDETVGFRYFDNRDLLGFVDGTANPVGERAVTESVLITAATGDDGDGGDAAGEGGSYIVVQKYLHDLASWRSLSTEAQEGVIGRTKLDNMELDDDGAPGEQLRHKSLATIEDGETGEEMDIVRDNMPFGSPGGGEYGTYFIGYAARLWVVERMLERMFVGVPAGRHDRILDFSRAVTGCVFFVPPLGVLEGLGGDA